MVTRSYVTCVYVCEHAVMFIELDVVDGQFVWGKNSILQCHVMSVKTNRTWIKSDDIV